MKQKVFVENEIMFGGRYEAKYERRCDNPHWEIRMLPDNPYSTARIVAQRGTRQEAFDKLWELVMGD